MKEKRVKCAQCGEKFTVIRLDRERISSYCDTCLAERKRVLARERMRLMRERKRAGW